MKAAPAGDEWLHELAIDGCRLLARVDQGTVQLVDERGLDRRDDFPTIADALAGLAHTTAIIDGAAAVQRADGTTSAPSLRNGSTRPAPGLAYFAFDLLFLDGEDLRGMPLVERKARLRRLVGDADRRGPLRFVDHVEGRGAEFFAAACRSGVRAIVSKRRDSAHASGSSDDWLETRCPSPRARSEEPVVAGLRISSPDRVIFADLGLSKLQLARYLDAVSERMVPHVAGRPLTLMWCPKGNVPDGCTYMRHSRVWGPDVLRRVRIPEKTKVGEYLVADDRAGLVALAQMDVVEIHTWNSTTDALEQPDRIVLDLDPGPAVPWREVVAAARLVRRAFQALSLESWVKTTGGAGLHVVVPLVPERDVAQCLAFARGVAATIAAHHPERFTTAMPKRDREAKILLDYLRNNRTNTSVAAFSPRARAGAPVSTPIAWDELTPALRADAFTVSTVPRRLARQRRDPWAAYFTGAQRISDEAFSTVV